MFKKIYRILILVAVVQLSFFVVFANNEKATNNNYVSSSVLATGNWYKMWISKSGVYRITFDELVKMGFNSPENIRVFGNGGKELPEVFSTIVQDDLLEIPIEMVLGNDGKFNSGDFIYFYAEGTLLWDYNYESGLFSHMQHPFSDKSCYFLTSSVGGKRIGVLESENVSNVEINSFDGNYVHHERLKNVLQSGQEWYGEEFGIQKTNNFSFSIQNLLKTEPVKVNSSVMARSTSGSEFVYFLNSQLIGNILVKAISDNSNLDVYGYESNFKGTGLSSSTSVKLSISFNNYGEQSAVGWLRYIELTARENLIMNTNQVLFRDSRSVKNGNVGLFSISNAASNIVVFDVSNIHQVNRIQGVFQNNTYSFKKSTSKLCEYVAFYPSVNLLIPEFDSDGAGKIENQNLHGMQSTKMIIISHSKFLKQANDLAEFHTKTDGLSVAVVTPEQIYNEFSSGIPSTSAIRNFVKMMYDKEVDSTLRLKYLLLFGDGSYDNKTAISTSKNTNYIITYQSRNSLNPLATYVSDDFFGMLHDNESIEDGSLEIGVGRFPVQDTLQARAMVNKVKKYYDKKKSGDWQNSICMLADDEDGSIHMKQADSLAKIELALKFPNFNIEKIYLDAYQQVPTSTGQRYPDVNLAINNQLNKGVLIFNYTGHGGERGLTHEQVMTQADDIKQWKNEILPLFITATCEFSRFDKYEEVTAGEDVLLNKNGGGIALLTTTRIAFSDLNFDLNQKFYQNALELGKDIRTNRLGDLMRITKNNAKKSVNKLCFTLLGDPALSLAVPCYRVVTDSINHQSANISDTLQSYSKVFVSGHITDNNGNIMNQYNGLVFPTIFDKAQHITTLSNDLEDPFSFKLQNNVLFRGKATVRDGYFSFQFIMPRDMDYSYGKGKLSYFATDFQTDAWGNKSDNLIIGGVSNNKIDDTDGPKIKLYMNDTTFKDGGITDATPTLLARVMDENGINPGGNGIGHDIVATLDNDPRKTFVLNNLYQSDVDTYQKGSVAFQFSDLTQGDHVVTFKIWDIFNNSSEATLNFKIPGNEGLTIQKLGNYPNPFSDYTNFVFEHNRPDENLSATIEIFSLSGEQIKKINVELNSQGYTSGNIYWDGTTNYGNKILRGIYLYRVVLRSNTETTISKSQKLLVLK